MKQNISEDESVIMQQMLLAIQETKPLCTDRLTYSNDWKLINKDDKHTDLLNISTDLLGNWRMTARSIEQLLILKQLRVDTSTLKLGNRIRDQIVNEIINNKTKVN